MSETTARVLVPIADGTEEMEFTIIVDVLRRAGVGVVTAGLQDRAVVTCSRGIRIAPDATLDAVTGDFDWIVLPGGGPGAAAFRDSARLGDLLRAQAAAGRGIAAICAASTALVAHGIGGGRPMTAHASVRDQVAAYGAWSDAPVVDDGDLVTSQGPGTAFPFALHLVARICGEDTAAQVRAPMQFPSAG